METLLLTGATGFIGRPLVQKILKTKKYGLHTIERSPSAGSHPVENPLLVRHHADLTDYESVYKIVKEVKPDYVVHLASISAVSYSYEHYLEATETDYLGTINLAEACRKESPNFKQFIAAGTSEEYGLTLKSMKEKLTEESKLHPTSPYAISKVAADYYLHYMEEAYDFPFTIIRAFNTYGRTDSKHFFIERTINQMLNEKRAHLGDPDVVRDWLYIDDNVDAYLGVIGNEKTLGETLQICTGTGHTTRQTAELIAKLTGFKGEITWNTIPPRPLDAKFIVGDASKAFKLMGWKPKHSLEEGLKKTIDFWSNKGGV